MGRVSRPGPPAGSRRTVRLDLQYEGTAYVGWQRQAKGASVQGWLEKALSRVADEPVTLIGASRTDAGVHAVHQAASFSLKESRTPVEAFVRGTNTLLPSDIRVLRAVEADLSFHASLDAKEKAYRYFLHVGEPPLLFLRNHAWTVPRPPDLAEMQRAATALLGEHDFSAFRAAHSETKSSVRNISSARWDVAPLGLWFFEIAGNGFLKHMVRNIVGTLVEIGSGKRASEDMGRILLSRDRKKAGPAAPPHGLFLWRVLY